MKNEDLSPEHREFANSKCVFCNLRETNNSTNSNYARVCDTKNFYAKVDLGALCLGHIDIIAKKHLPSMAYLSTEEMEELIYLRKYLSEKITNKIGLPPIFFEHGSAPNCGNLSGCCIEHAHLQAVPTVIKKEKLDNVFAQVGLKQINGMSALRDFKGQPYLYFGDKNGDYISQEVVPSQYFRKIIRPEKWNWKENPPEYETIKETLNIFNGAVERT
jgi:diadenosine tetraphosphate (Ap4A) HIT family hydrolase